MWNLVLFTMSCVLAGLLGFSAHRAGICTVKATAEVLSTGRAFFFRGFAKTVLWVLVITLPVFWLLPDDLGARQGWAVSASALGGGVLFGIGAAVNGACAFSTLTRLCDGRLEMLATLAGFALGAVVYPLSLEAGWVPAPRHAPPMFTPEGDISGILAILLLIWAVWEISAVWRSRPRNLSLMERLRARQYRLSTAGAVIGICNGFLYLQHGSWSFTNTLRDWSQSLSGPAVAPGLMAWVLFGAVLTGMVISAVERKSFNLVWRPRPDWLMKALGGGLMGYAAGLIPGGNDVLLLHEIPLMSPHAVPAYLCMVLGIAVILVVVRVVGGRPMTVRCSNDICLD